MIRYLIIFLIFCSSVFAEIIEIDPGVKIKIPEGKAFYTTNPLDDFKNNAISRKFTSKETKYVLKEFTNIIKVSPMNWVKIKMKRKQLLMVICDKNFSERDYIRDYKKFLYRKNLNLR